MLRLRFCSHPLNLFGLMQCSAVLANREGQCRDYENTTEPSVEPRTTQQRHRTDE
jgi:hypothetical protein